MTDIDAGRFGLGERCDNDPASVSEPRRVVGYDGHVSGTPAEQWAGCDGKSLTRCNRSHAPLVTPTDCFQRRGRERRGCERRVLGVSSDKGPVTTDSLIPPDASL
ncbi:uncharacterized protein UV8b_07851 [Ustilaginoidea virens]|uniref:Uncharacterized protein n=1 Tax=Ustilaginoidea virens TaxID=1159556 RepID=A0A8E5HYA7_USTVR|nr:uncharacterized protein UV8b_07851 [Ustilaginoidea virens]QUC23610.1 hypothetical protein UV8b_07851 [Ustilaginoidea virens]